MNICVGMEQTGSSGARNPWVSINPLSAWVRDEHKESKEEYRWVACVDTITVLIRSAIEKSLCYIYGRPTESRHRLLC
jgi:hypothetical protein